MKIDLGEVFYLDMDIVVEAPFPNIYLGRAKRNPGPPTTRALAETLIVWQAEQLKSAEAD